MSTATADSDKTTERKVVTFDSRIMVHETLHRLDFSYEEEQNYWYNTLEREYFRVEANDIGLKIERRQKIGNHICTRGLEAQSAKGFEARRRVRKRARRAVFREQERQRQQGITNEYGIALVYENQTTQCQVVAITRGITDKLECDRLWYKTKSCDPCSPCRSRPLNKLATATTSTSPHPRSTLRRESFVSTPRFLRMKRFSSLAA